jgi:hypothetical protein
MAQARPKLILKHQGQQRGFMWMTKSIGLTPHIYKVVECIDTLTARPGELLQESEVQRLIDDKQIEVRIQ